MPDTRLYSRAYCLKGCGWHVESDTIDPAIDRKADRHCKNEKHGTVSGLERKEGPRAKAVLDRRL